MRIVITGGSGGIGNILLDVLIKSNEVFIISRSKDRLDAALKKFKKVKGYAADVSNYKEIESAFKKIGEFDALINCAGILGPVGNLEQNDISAWEQTVRVNLLGTVNCCKAALPILKNNKNAKIINFSGGGSAFPRVYHGAYATSKAAIVRFTENLAKDLEHDQEHIDVNVIAPGAYKTRIWNGETFDKEPPEWGDPTLLLKLVQFLLSEKSNGISGKFLHVKDDYTKLERSISKSDLYTLRRIDNFNFREV